MKLLGVVRAGVPAVGVFKRMDGWVGWMGGERGGVGEETYGMGSPGKQRKQMGMAAAAL